MRMKMKRVFRRNQIIITTLAIMIAAAGYLNYAGKSDLPGADTYEAGATKISDSDIYSENQAVSGSVADGEYEEIASLDDPGEGDPLAAGSEEGTAQGAADGEEASADNPAVDNPGEAVLTGGTGVAEYIANVQLSREQIRAKNREALNALINNENLDASAKEAAVQDMLALNAIAEKENAAETLLMAKGFADPVVSITDGKVDVVVNAPSITDPQRAQIEDIVKRKTEISAENIVISLLNLGISRAQIGQKMQAIQTFPGGLMVQPGRDDAAIYEHINRDHRIVTAGKVFFQPLRQQQKRGRPLFAAHQLFGREQQLDIGAFFDH